LSRFNPSAVAGVTFVS